MKVNNDDDDDGDDDDNPIFVLKLAVLPRFLWNTNSFQVKVTELIRRYDYIIQYYAKWQNGGQWWL